MTTAPPLAFDPVLTGDPPPSGALLGRVAGRRGLIGPARLLLAMGRHR
jgi:hypothetical protein